MSNVRSPVEIVTSGSKAINQTSPEMDQTISIVPRRKGDILLHHSPPNLPQRRSTQSVWSRLVDEPTGSIRTTRIGATLLPQNQQSSTSASTYVNITSGRRCSHNSTGCSSKVHGTGSGESSFTCTK